MNKVNWPYKLTWRRLFFGLYATATSVFFLFFNLTSLAPSLSTGEKSSLAGSADFRDIVNNPLNGPIKILQFFSKTFLDHDTLLMARLPSVFLALIALGLFIFILKRWYGPRSTVFGFSILVASAWFLHVGRFAGSDIEYLVAILGLMAVQIGLYQKREAGMMYLWMVVNLILLFIPGFIWFVLLGLVWQKADLIEAWQSLKTVWLRLPSLGLSIIGLLALGVSLWRSPKLLLGWLGLPQHLAVSGFLHQLINTLQDFTFQGPYDPQLWLARLPILDAFLGLMLLAGLIFYVKHWQAARTKLLLGYFLLGIILVSLGGEVKLSIILPIVYLVVVAGIAYILHFWLVVYPNNPLARAVGISVVSLAIVLSCTYNLEQYFIAWPHNPETIKVYQKSSS